VPRKEEVSERGEVSVREEMSERGDMSGRREVSGRELPRREEASRGGGVPGRCWCRDEVNYQEGS
jgi:hypothetical protein